MTNHGSTQSATSASSPTPKSVYFQFPFSGKCREGDNGSFWVLLQFFISRGQDTHPKFVTNDSHTDIKNSEGWGEDGGPRGENVPSLCLYFPDLRHSSCINKILIHPESSYDWKRSTCETIHSDKLPGNFLRNLFIKQWRGKQKLLLKMDFHNS